MNSKNVFITVLIMLVFGIRESSAQCYELVWSDEFNYTGYPDPAIWYMEVGNNNGNNNEKQYYTRNDSDNCYVDSGRMVITARKENLGGQAYTSARINSKGKAEFMYGKVESRFRLPYGQGIWPAFWMLGGNIDQVGWPKCGEMDIMEMIGGSGSRDRTTYGTNHWADNNGNHVYQGGNKSLPSGKFADDYHIFSYTWDKQKASWFLDGVQFYTMSLTSSVMSEFHEKYFIIFNLAVGGQWPGYPDASTVFPQKFEVDYVRVYKLAENEVITGKDSVVAKEKNLSFSIPSAGGRQFLWTVPDGATLLSRADSNAIAVDWGCTQGEVICNITTACTTSVVKSKSIPVYSPLIEGPLFYDKTPGNLSFKVPLMSETKYHWDIPAGATFVSNDSSAVTEVTWGTGTGTVNLQVINSCDTRNLSKKIYKYGQYPYPDPDSAFVIPGTINATNFDYGGEGVSYHDTGSGNQGTGGPREDENVDTQSQALFPSLGFIATGEWLEYTIKVPQPGYYKIEMLAATPYSSTAGPIRVLINGEQRITDIPVPVSGGWTVFKPVSGRLLYLNAGDSILRLEAVLGNFNLGPITLVVDNSVSIDEQYTGNQLLDLYPNPVTTILNVTFPQAKTADVQIDILDISGKQILSYDFKRLEKGNQKIVISENIRTLHPGVYFIEIRSAGQKYFSKFLKN